jgi:hypothetical protein
VVAALPRLALAADETDLEQVAHRPGDGSRAHPEQLGQLGGRAAAVLGAEDGREHPRRHAGHARVGQIEGEALDEPPDGLVVPPGRCSLDHAPSSRLRSRRRRHAEAARIPRIHKFVKQV